MVAGDSLPPAFRASDADREDVIRILRKGSADGRLSTDTFLRRVDRALRARGVGELAGLHHDLPPTAPAPAWGARVRDWWAASAATVRAALSTSRPPPLVLPRGPRTVFTIGRSGDCDLALGHPTVSRRHAELRRTGDAWILVDVGSTNGTRVNGWRADSGITVRPGDCVRFGALAFRLTDRG